MFPEIKSLVNSLDTNRISNLRLQKLSNIIRHVQGKVDLKQAVYLNFICTHNSRRSHLAQIWSQVMARFYEVPLVFCLSGGTEATAMHPNIIKSLIDHGFEISITKKKKSNPRYFICYSENQPPIVGFSKKYNHKFNQVEDYAAIMVCDDANENCPIVYGAVNRFALTYSDPKISDHTPEQDAVYRDRSIEIATEMKYIFSQIDT